MAWGFETWLITENPPPLRGSLELVAGFELGLVWPVATSAELSILNIQFKI